MGSSDSNPDFDQTSDTDLDQDREGPGSPPLFRVRNWGDACVILEPNNVKHEPKDDNSQHM